MKKLIFIIVTLMVVNLSAVNHLDMMFQMVGDQNYGQFGGSMASLDFNGDGYTDLAIIQVGWVPDSLYIEPLSQAYGRILFYYGGPGFDSVADFIIEGTYDGQLVPIPAFIVNCGDVNGDGYEDLGTMGYTPGNLETRDPYLAIYYGGQNPSTQPGYYQAFITPYWYESVEINPVGDVNNDGFDDFSYTYKTSMSNPILSRSAIVLGGATSMTEITWRQFNIDDYSAFSAVGDVNTDGFDDFICTFGLVVPNGNSSLSNTLYFGCPNITEADSLVLYTGPIQATFIYRTKYLGDLNGDGIDDFTGLILNSNIHVWYGSENLTTQDNVGLLPGWAGGTDDRGLVHGDLNGDGYDDVIGSDPFFNGQDGAIRIWLGGTNMNSMMDLYMDEDTYGMQYGLGLAAGDFNGDGLCDIAVGAPHSPGNDYRPGKVFVYSGNTELADTTISNDDNISEQVVPDWSFTVVPNPVRSRQTWKLQFTGKGYDKYSDMSVKIYNLKGQKVKTLRITGKQAKAGEVNLPDLNLPGGVYEISLYDKGKLLKTKKATFK